MRGLKILISLFSKLTKIILLNKLNYYRLFSVFINKVYVQIQTYENIVFADNIINTNNIIININNIIININNIVYKSKEILFTNWRNL